VLREQIKPLFHTLDLPLELPKSIEDLSTLTAYCQEGRRVLLDCRPAPLRQLQAAGPREATAIRQVVDNRGPQLHPVREVLPALPLLRLDEGGSVTPESLENVPPREHTVVEHGCLPSYGVGNTCCARMRRAPLWACSAALRAPSPRRRKGAAPGPHMSRVFAHRRGCPSSIFAGGVPCPSDSTGTHRTHRHGAGHENRRGESAG